MPKLYINYNDHLVGFNDDTKEWFRVKVEEGVNPKTIPEEEKTELIAAISKGTAKKWGNADSQ